MTQPDEIEALTAALVRDLEAVHARILTILDGLARALPGLPATARERRLRDVDRRITALIDEADAIAATHVLAATQRAYEIGGWATALTLTAVPEFAGVDVDAVTHIAQDAMSNLLRATRYMRGDVKTVIRDLTREQALFKVTTGQPAVQAGRDLAARLAERGITAVVYANGRTVPLPVYAQMVVRTKTAEAYQEGGFNQGERLGVEWWEVLDGPGCGWVSHDDPQGANGMIVSLAEARQHPLSHPNCRRSTSPRPDLASRDGDSMPPTSRDAAAAVQDAAVRAQAAAARHLAVSATPRRSSAPLEVAGVPAALARHVARVG